MAIHNTPSRRWMKLQTLGLIILLSNAPRRAIAKSQSFTLGDLPTCALMCATQAASAVNCTMNDIACLCSHPNFTTSTIQCADINGQCPIEDRASVDGVLSAICLAGSTLSASSPSSPSSSSSSSSQGDPISTSKGLGPGPIKPLPSTTSNSPPSSSSTSSSPSPSPSPSEPSATPSSTDDVSSLISSSQPSATSTPTTATTPASQSASSTTVVVQTIMVPPTSLASSAVREQREVWIMMFLGLVGMCLCAGI